MPRKGLVVRVDGKKVLEEKNRVDRVRILTARGEVSSFGIEEWDEVIDVVVERAGFLNRRSADVIEEEAEKARELTKEREKDGSGREEDLSFRDRVGTNPDKDIDKDPKSSSTSDKDGKK